MNDLPTIYERCLEFVCRSDITELVSALIRAAAEEPPDEFPIQGEPSVASQLFIVYDAAPLEVKEKMKTALVAALLEWKPQWHGYQALKTFVLAAGYMRATGVIDILRRLIASSDIKPERPSGRDALGTIFGVLGGFAPLPAVRTALDRAQHDERYQKHFAAQIMNGLCYCDPEGYPRYLKTFLQSAAGRKAYRPMDVVAEMVRLIGTEVVLRRAVELEWEANELVQTVLLRMGHKPHVQQDGTVTYIDLSGRAVLVQETDDGADILAIARARKNQYDGLSNYGRWHSGQFITG